MKIFHLISIFYKKYPFLFIINVLIVTIVCFTQIISTLLIAPVVDVFINSETKNLSSITEKLLNLFTLTGIAPSKINILLAFLLSNILLSAFIILANWSILKAQYAMIKTLAIETYDAFFNSRWHFFSTQCYGSIMNTLTREIDGVKSAFVSMGNLFSEFIRAFFFLLVPLCISWEITLITIAFVSALLLPSIFINKVSYKLGRKSTKASNIVMEVIHESLGAAKVILGYGNHGAYMKRFAKVFGDRCDIEVKSHVLSYTIPKIFEPFGWIVILTILYISSEYLLIPLSEIGIIGYALFRIIPMIRGLTSFKQNILRFYPSYEQVDYMIRLAVENIQKTGKIVFTNLKEGLTYQGVGFAYPGNAPVLNDIDLIIRKGEVTAIVGESGSGKSTLIDLLIGFYEPDRGIISLDNIPLSDVDILSFRRHIGYVPQDVVLFNDSVRNNLLWSYEKASDTEIEESCKLANAHDFIINLPEGYNTIVGERGVRLSGGERQRIALARALLRKPVILILDEATSSLDSHSELLIQRAVEKIALTTTIVVIAHRLSTIVKADSIYVLKEGQIIEQGKYDNLIKSNGAFKQAAEIQRLVHSG